MNILFIQPPHIYGTQRRKADFFPLGLASVIGLCKSAGHTCTVFDLYLNEIPVKDIPAAYPRGDYDVVAISALSTQFNFVQWIVEGIKALNPHATIVLGGALATYSPKIVLEHTKVDVCVVGEGEETFLEFLSWYKSTEMHEIDGVAWKDDGIIINHPRPYIKDLDSIPFPDREAFDFDGYLDNCVLPGTNINRTANIVTSRGCPYSCNFCSKTFTGARFRSIDNVIAEITHLKERYGIKGVFFNDELVVVTKKRALELAEKIAPLGLSWCCQARCNTVDASTLAEMKKAGCVLVGLGVESGSQRILNNMNKKITPEQSKKAMTMIFEAGIQPCPQMIFGYPGEDDESIAENIAFFKDLGLSQVGFSMLTPFPGSKIYDDCVRDGIIKDEYAYLKRLDEGCMGNRKPLVNLTGWTDDELVAKKAYLEKTIAES